MEHNKKYVGKQSSIDIVNNGYIVNTINGHNTMETHIENTFTNLVNYLAKEFGVTEIDEDFIEVEIE